MIDFTIKIMKAQLGLRGEGSANVSRGIIENDYF